MVDEDLILKTIIAIHIVSIIITFAILSTSLHTIIFRFNLATRKAFIALNQGAGVCVVATLLFRILRVATVALTISVFKLFLNPLHWFTLRLAPGEPNWRTKARVSIKNLIAEV